MQKIFTILTLFFSFFSNAQQSPQGRPSGGQSMNNGHFYGRIIGIKSNKPVDGATIQLTGSKFDTATKKAKILYLPQY